MEKEDKKRFSSLQSNESPLAAGKPFALGFSEIDLREKNRPMSLPTGLKTSGVAISKSGLLDKFLLTCLITLTFTTIPYYSCDYLLNQFIGITPKNELLNNHNLRVNYNDFSSLLGMPLSDRTLVLNTDVSLYDRAHFMYGEWPTSFESLNYQGELFWTNLKDHRRQKRTRRSTRVKFKNLKSKIATSWKAFKRNDSLSERQFRNELPLSENEDKYGISDDPSFSFEEQQLKNQINENSSFQSS